MSKCREYGLIFNRPDLLRGTAREMGVALPRPTPVNP